MVDAEELDVTTVKTTIKKFRGENPYRKPNGKWYWNLHIEIELELPDGRKLIVQEILTARPKQVGRKPNPKAFGKST